MTPNPPRMPALFVGHGTPMNAIGQNGFTRAWRELGAALPRPRAILSVSAHWYVHGTFVTANARPPTIHDFAGFPQPLFEVRYDAPGEPALAARLVEMLGAVPARAATGWGLDHGTWSVLVHLYPAADVPVVQLSIDAAQPPSFHYALGRSLAPLREQGILLLGSGGIVHNLARVDWSGAGPPPSWATEFDAFVRAQVLAGEDAPLVPYAELGASARMSVPTPDHYLPLLYVLGSRQPGEAATIPLTGFDLGSLSMTSVLLGAA